MRNQAENVNKNVMFLTFVLEILYIIYITRGSIDIQYFITYIKTLISYKNKLIFITYVKNINRLKFNLKL